MKPHYSQTLYRAFWFDMGVRLTRLLGVKWTRLVARALAEGYGLTHPRTRSAVRENLGLLCGPRLPKGAVRRTFRNFGATLADYFQLGAGTRKDALSLIEREHGFVNIQSALSDGKGVLLSSERAVPGPRQQLRYVFESPDRFTAAFSLLLPGAPDFAPYLTWTSARSKSHPS